MLVRPDIVIHYPLSPRHHDRVCVCLRERIIYTTPTTPRSTSRVNVNNLLVYVSQMTLRLRGPDGRSSDKHNSNNIGSAVDRLQISSRRYCQR